MPHWLSVFCTWLKLTPLSQSMQPVEWLVPLVQVVHILAVCAVISSVLIIALRLAGFVSRDRPVAQMSARFLPVIWCALPVLLLTGSVLIIIEPVRSLGSIAFQLKMALLVLAIIIMLVYQSSLARDPTRWERPGSRFSAALLAIVSLLPWIGIIFAGRWIAYAPGQ